MESIFKRRSIRKYKDQEVSKEQIKKILEAGMAAPSAGNEMPWKFLVIQDKDMLSQVAGVSPYSKMAANASAAIIVMGDLKLEVYKGFWVQDCSAAIQNMLLMITEMGLGSVWLGVYPFEDRTQYIKELFSLPENLIPLAILPLGYPGERPGPANRYDEKNVYYEKIK